MLAESMKKTSQNLALIRITAFIENFMNQKIWYTYVIRLDGRHTKEDLNRMKDHLISHMPTIEFVEIVNNDK